MTLSAAQDADVTAGTARIRGSAPGWADQDVAATEADDDVLALVTDVSAVEVPEGATAAFGVVTLALEGGAPLHLVQRAAGSKRLKAQAVEPADPLHLDSSRATAHEQALRQFTA